MKPHKHHFGLPPTSGVGGERERKNSISRYGEGSVLMFWLGSGFSKYKEFFSERTQDKHVADSTAVALEDSLAQGPVLVQRHLLVATIHSKTKRNTNFCDYRLINPQFSELKSVFWIRYRSRARICKRLRSPGIDSKESILPAYVGLLYRSVRLRYIGS
jgi:hypothetical protein